MKKITVYDMFLVFAIILNTGTGRNVYTAIILLCAGLLELMDVISKIVRLMKHGGK
ncbi:hypothetical protein AALB51_25340 [Lachnospiraceae bacterium 62-26]